MTAIGWIQLLIFSGLLLLLTKPLGVYLFAVLEGGKTLLDPVLGPVERIFYRLFGIDPKREQGWKNYTLALLMFSVVGMLLIYGILRLQGYLPLNPAKEELGTALNTHLSFNTAASFTTNTNWQSYAGEDTMSYFSQMFALAVKNFTSAAVGIAIAAALVRGIARSRAGTIGNFWVDLVRTNLYLLLPLSLVLAIFLVSQGMLQNFDPYVKAAVVETQGAGVAAVTEQTIAQGPVASQVAIKMLGTNGGGFFNVNAAHPYENPTPLSNFVQMLAIFAIPAGLTYYLGRMVKNQKHGWTIWGVMFALFLAGTIIAWAAEANGNPRMAAAGISAADGNMEGKEVRFGIFNSALFATITTDASCGAVNAMHDSFTPIGGLVPLFNMQLGEVIFGGVGAGLYGMLIFVVLAIFIAGLMVGRTPEYLGKKIESFDVKVATLAVLAPAFAILGFAAWAVVSKWGVAGLNNGGPHGFTEILYAYTSSASNNGSAFAGLTANPANGDWHYDTTLGLAMLIGRFFIIVPVMALAGNMAAKKLIPPSGGSFPVAGATFGALLIGTVIIVGALTFLPALALGPVVEHFIMHDLPNAISY
ncbi:MAG: potassium-transporting ATPase subunit KdpA [Burkholderiales bacterium]|nr:potassium-transporting ATPase subunit KdpA [Phycisphaerae bacterium]